MIKLCGFSVSNYYNKVKLALLEKEIPFSEEVVYPSADESLLKRSPMGKVPFIEVDGGVLSESQAILEYLEACYPEPPLYPRDPFAAAKCRELIQCLELYLDLPARRLHPIAFYGGGASEETLAQVKADLAQGVRAFTRLLRLEPFIAGPHFSYADCAAFAHLPVVSMVTRLVYQNDMLADVPGLAPYLKRLGERPPALTVNADRKAALEAFMAYRSGQGNTTSPA